MSLQSNFFTIKTRVKKVRNISSLFYITMTHRDHPAHDINYSNDELFLSHRAADTRVFIVHTLLVVFKLVVSTHSRSTLSVDLSEMVLFSSLFFVYI